LIYGWTHSFLFHLLKAGHLKSFLRGLGAGLSASGHALKKRGILKQARRDRREDLWRLMRTC
jgi:hypothetical protein